MEFETKKINSETLGEYLKAVRQAFRLTIPDVAEATGVNSKLVTVLEEGKMQNLPADVYVIGALNKLAKFYNLSESELQFQYKKERSIARHITGKTNPAVMQITNFWKQLVITPKVLLLLGAGLFVAFTVIYLLWQVSAINRSPDLEIISPKNEEVVKSLSVKVVGQTDRGASVLVNGQEIFVDNQGKFSNMLSLVPGVQEITVLSKNRFGKESKKAVKVIIENSSELQNNQVKLELRFSSAVNIKYVKDSDQAVERDFNAEENLVIEAKEKIEIISVGDGGAVQGVLNGQPLGPLGKKGEPLTKVTFYKESGGN
ncbi:MAG: helix-turn-helix domain-containing protein [Candidatus Doudnabacteria bacterium]|nr:helix-turn-helix domain-containing protein [Candidatus Doudnabacteria bacterium]